MNKDDRTFRLADIVQHFKREMLTKKDIEENPYLYLYHIIGEGYFTETNEKVMIYQALYGEKNFYVRPYDMFISEVDKDLYPEIKQNYRFEKVNEEEFKKIWEVLKKNEKKNECNG